MCAKQRVRQRTFEDYSAAVARSIAGKPLGRQAVATITPADIQEHYSNLLAAGCSPHSVRKAHAVLRQALQQAVRWRELGVNPALSVDLPKIKRKPELRIIEPDKLQDFVQAALQEQRLGALWILAASTGMRPEEYLGLTWQDLGANFRQLTIQRVLVRATKAVPGEPRWRFEPPKTEKSRRTLALEPECALFLRQHRIQQNIEKLAAGPAYEDHGLVFATELGAPLDSNNLRNRNLKRILKRAGLPENLTLYSLRHSAATALLKDQESLRIVADLLGHSTTRLTGDLYSHVPAPGEGLQGPLRAGAGSLLPAGPRSREAGAA